MAVAANQGGRLSRRQALDCGLSDDAIRHRVRKGILEREHHGVLRIAGMPRTAAGPEWAAVLWAGGDACVSQDSAAHAYGTLTRPPLVHITITSHNPGTTPGVRVHRAEQIPEQDRRTRQGLPLTSPLRTLVDCAAEMSEPALERLIAEFQIARLIGDHELETAAATPVRGMPKLRAILDDTNGLTRSEAERLLARLIADAGLPRPIQNAFIDEEEFDAYWPEHGLVLEFHGYGPHRTRKKFESDAIRSALLAGRNLRLMTATWRRLTRQPTALAVDIATALAVAQGDPPSARS